MSKQIFIVFGHNNYKSGSSFNAAIRDTFIKEAKKNGHTVDLLNIYEEKQLNFWSGEKPSDQVLDYRKRLETADVMLIMSPCHNYIMNSATENFIANVFTPPWSFSYKKIIGNWGYPIPNALKDKIAIISMTYGGPSFFVSAILQQIPRRIKKMVFNGLCGMKVKYLRFYEVLPNMPKEIFEKHIEKARNAARQL
jgi:NAD(P)H dehydrogenase (quinone)|tara:strand:- start:71 stop:655 length:585 start_codon:yes stop_codon:yes gene_type:complete